MIGIIGFIGFIIIISIIRSIIDSDGLSQQLLQSRSTTTIKCYPHNAHQHNSTTLHSTARQPSA